MDQVTQPSASPRPSLTRRVVQRAGNAAMTVVTLICIAWLATSLFGFSRYVITGGSMTGSISKGSLAFERSVPVSQLEVGDVITYLPPADSGVSNLVTHRILEITTEPGKPVSYRTKGDANATADSWTFELTQSTQPVVSFTVPALGYVFVALADRDTRMLVIGIPAALLALLSLVELVVVLRRPATAAGEQPATAAGETSAA
ncbi:MAG: signal peptidase I [Terracoccus sp.]